MNRRLRTACLALGAVAMAITGSVAVVTAAQAATGYYIATDGNDANDGSLDRPFATINKCYQLVQPGGTCFVRGGTYYNLGETYLSKSGTDGNYITIRNYPGETPVLDGSGKDGVAFYYGEGNQGAGLGSWTVIDGFVIRNYWRSGINIGCCSADGGTKQTVSHVIVRNNVIDRTGQNGITFMQAGDIRVEHNLVGRTGWDPGTGSWSSGINFYGMYGTNNIATGNVSYHNIDLSSYHTDGNGFICDLTYYQGGCRFEDNIAFENGGSGIQATHSSNIVMTNNTTFDNGKESTYINGGVGLGFWGTESMTNATVVNNIGSQSFGKGLITDGSFNNSTVSNNNISGESGASDPQFTDAGNADFSLKSSSPSVDAGTSANAAGNSLIFDPKALMQSTSNQPVSWFHYAPNFDYITSRGGVANLFGTGTRPQGGGYDQGAYESGSTGTGGTGTGGTDPGGSTGGTGGTNVVSNGTFDSGTANWWTYFSGATGTIAAHAGTGLDGTALKFDLSNGSDQDWKAQVGQTVSLTAGHAYTLTFKARADQPRTVGVLVQQTAAPYTEYLRKTASLTSSGQTFTYTFTPSAGGETYLKFQAGGSSTDLYLDSISLS